MKGITIPEPWASLLVFAPELKKFATLPYKCTSEEKLLIVSGSLALGPEDLDELEQAIEAIDLDNYTLAKDEIFDLDLLESRVGKVIGSARLCYSTKINPEISAQQTEMERACGSWLSTNHFVEFANLKPEASPKALPGQQPVGEIWTIAAKHLVTNIDMKTPPPPTPIAPPKVQEPPVAPAPEPKESEPLMPGSDFDCFKVSVKAEGDLTVSYSFLSGITGHYETITGHVVEGETAKPRLLSAIGLVKEWALRQLCMGDHLTVDDIEVSSFSFKKFSEEKFSYSVRFKTEAMPSMSSVSLSLQHNDGMPPGLNGEYARHELKEVKLLKKLCDEFCAGDRVPGQGTLNLTYPECDRQAGLSLVV